MIGMIGPRYVSESNIDTFTLTQVAICVPAALVLRFRG